MNNVVVPIQQEEQWTDGLMLNTRGEPLGNLRNVLHALRNAPDWRNVIAYDSFGAEVITIKPLPGTGETVTKWADQHDSLACEWFQEQEIPASVGTVGRGIQTVAHENTVHPVRKYLNGLKWDATPRLDTWLTMYLGVTDSEYVQAIGSRFLISAVARVFEPGCQADHMLILEGQQGLQKSSALRALASPWFTDRMSRVGSKDSAVEVSGVWLIEMSELDALTRASNSAIKSFVTRRHDRFRPPYGRHVVERPRQCVFAGSINPTSGYLTDPTGARRFWPVACGNINIDDLRRDRDQLWAEAVARFRAGSLWWLETPELEALAAAEQELRFEEDSWAERIGQWLTGRNNVSVSEVLVGALGLASESWSHSAEIRIANILVSRDNGFKRYRPGAVGWPRTPRYRREEGDHHGEHLGIKFDKKSD